MKNTKAEELLFAYLEGVQETYGVRDASKEFSLTPPLEQKLRKKVEESVGFLSLIHTEDVQQINGQVVEVGGLGLRSGRKQAGRFTSDIQPGGHKYQLVDIDSCAAITWYTLANWSNVAGKGEFMSLVNETSYEAFALDMLRIGFNGKTSAADTDPNANPNGEDIAPGWQQYVGEKAPNQIVTTDVYLDAGGKGNYKTLDAMASDLINNKIHAAYRNHPDLVVLVGQDLISYESGKIYDEATTPSEKIKAQMLPYTIAGRKAYVPPFMPGKRMIVTTLKNLQILTQAGSRRRKSKDEEDRKQFENSYWRMEGYAVGRLEAYAAYEESKVHIGPKP